MNQDTRAARLPANSAGTASEFCGENPFSWVYYLRHGDRAITSDIVDRAEAAGVIM